jgi:hypothetical protein
MHNSMIRALRARSLRHSLCVLALAAAWIQTPARAQEAPNAPAATQPAAGHATVREQIRYIRFRSDAEEDARRIEEWTAWTSVAIGLTGDLSLTFEAPLVYRETDGGPDDGTHSGLADMTLALKWRFFQKDYGPIDTLRVALLVGTELPSGDDQLSSDSVDPEIGLIATYIRGRHGFGGALRYKFTTGAQQDPINAGETLADQIRYDASYLYRAAPAEYAADTHGSLYLVLELNGSQETNGDSQLFLAPGIMYEARSWAAEFSLGLPVWQDLQDRPDADFIFRWGVRLLF